MRQSIVIFLSFTLMVALQTTSAIAALDDERVPDMVAVAPGVTLASLDAYNDKSSLDGCIIYDRPFFQSGSKEVSVAAAYQSASFLNNQGVRVWEVLPHGAHFTNDTRLPMWMLYFGNTCDITEVYDLVVADIAAVEEQGNYEIGGLVSYLSSEQFRLITYGGGDDYFGGEIDPANDSSCHADTDNTGLIRNAGAKIIHPDIRVRAQIHRVSGEEKTKEKDFVLEPGETTIEVDGVDLRYWPMINCSVVAAHRDAIGSPPRREAVAYADTAGYVRDWEADPQISMWISHVPTALLGEDN